MKQSTNFLACVFLVLTAFAIGWAQQPELVLQIGLQSIRGVAFSSDGKYLAVYDRSAGVLSLRDIGTGAELRQFAVNADRTDLFAPNPLVGFSPDGKILAAFWKIEVHLWDVSTGADRIFRMPELPEAEQDSKLETMQAILIGRGPDLAAVAFSPDGKTLIGYGSREVISWDVSTGAQVRSFKEHKVLSQTLIFSPDRKTCAGVVFAEKTAKVPGALKLWDAATGAELRVLGVQDAKYVKYLAFSPDGKTLAAGDDSEVNLWDVRTGAELRKFTGDVDGVAFSPDGSTLAIAGGAMSEGVKLWDVKTGVVVSKLKSLESFTVAFSPDGKTLFVGGSAEATLWDVVNGAELYTLRRHTYRTGPVAFSPDGKALVFHGSGGLQLWEFSAGATPHLLSPASPDALAFSPDGKTLSLEDNFAVSVLDAGTGAELRTNKGVLFKLEDKHLPSAHAFSPDGKSFAAGGTDGTVKLGEAGTELRAFRLHKIDPKFSKDFGEYPAINALAFSPDGKTLAIGDSFGTVTLRDVDTGAESRTFRAPDRFVNALAFSPDGKTLAGVDESYGDINLWEVSTGRLLRTFMTELHIFSKIAFSPDGKTLVAKAGNTGAGLWDVGTGAALHTLKGPVNDFAFSPDSKTLAVSEMGTGRLKLWDTRSGQELAALIAIDKKDWMVVTPDGLFDGSPAAWNLLLWRFNKNTFDVASVEVFFNEFFYPELLADIMAGKRPKPTQSVAEKDRRQPQVKILSAEPLSAANNSDWDAKDTRLYMHVKVEVTEAPADKDHKQGSGARDVRLFRDGTLVKLWHDDVLGGKDHTQLEADVPVLPDENHFTAYAFNHDNVKSSDAALTVKGDRTTGDRQPLVRTAYVLAIGVNTYENKQYNLKYAVADAQDIGQEWARQQELQKQFQHVELVTLLDDEATKANILLAIKQLVDLQPQPLPAGAPKQLAQLKYAEPQDAVLIYFAGHGTALGNRFYLIPHDLGYKGNRRTINEAAIQLLLAHSISDLELEQAFEGLQSGQQLFVIDACNSGQALEAEEKRRGPMNSKGLAQLAYEKGMYILTAAQSYQAAQEASKLGHGFLTYALVEDGLKQGEADREPKDGKIDLREWLNYATEQVPRMQETNMLDALRGGGRFISFAGDGTAAAADGTQAKNPGKGDVQRPRIFYRRELETNPLVVAILGAPSPQ